MIGMGGFAGRHHNTLLKLEEEEEARLVATCDPGLSLFAESMEAWNFRQRGVRVFETYLRMLDACGGELDMVVIPTPIQFHAEMHKECVRRRIPVYLEKPPTLVLSELETMIETDLRQRKRTNVGFNFMVEPPRLELKRRLLAGEFGRLRRVGFRGLSPRPESYFTRNNWAGKLFVGEKPVLDSCMGNAMAHYVHNSLFWAGESEMMSWAQVDSVRAEIYRANPIENADVFFVHAETPEGVGLDLAITHACEAVHQEEILWCDRAVIRYRTSGGYSFEWNDGRKEEFPFDREDLLAANHRSFYDYLRGGRPRPVTLLEDCRSFVQLYNLAYVSSGGITSIPDEYLSSWDKAGDRVIAVNGIASAAERFVEQGEPPSAQGISWAVPPRHAASRDEVDSLEKLIWEWRRTA